MATKQAFIDDWTGDADINGFTEAEERAIIDAGLESVAKHGLVAPAEADRRIEALLARLRGG